MARSEEPVAAPAPTPAATARPLPRRQKVGNGLTLTREGDDVVFAWPATGLEYDVVASTTARFLNPELLSHQTTAGFTYSGALGQGGEVEYFDVTDETETNRGEDGAGNLPPPPPVVDGFAGGTTLAIGQQAVINGSGFSEVPGDNVICFDGGICLHPDSATTTQLTFTVPPSAVSGQLWVTLGQLDSAPISFEVRLDPISEGTFRSVAFAPRPNGVGDVGGEYWTTSMLSGSNYFYRHYYDPATGDWLKANMSGSYGGSAIHYLSSSTDRFGNLYAAYATQSTSGGSRRIPTDPPANAANCINLGAGSGASPSANVVGAAVDPNPDALAGRDVAYFAYRDISGGYNYVKKVNVTAGSCTSISDSSFGNKSNWSWGASDPVGMAVDPATGDLYVTEVSKITKVTPGEAVTEFKSGFQRLVSLAIWHEPGTAYGALLAADLTASAVKMIALDSAALPAQTVASGSSVRTVTWARSTFSATSFTSALMNRMTFAHNTGGLVALWPIPSLMAEPSGSSSRVWISSPDTGDKAGPWQTTVRQSDPAATGYSTFKVVTWWRDGVARDVCAMLGDAESTAGYETTAPGSGCFLPWDFAPISLCDNQESFNGSAGVGTSTGTGAFEECESACGTGRADACEFEFRISQRYAGDNYRVYFYQPGTDLFGSIASSALVTAWKRAYVENDRMCRVGGMLYADQSKDPDADVDETQVRIAKEKVGSSWEVRDNLARNRDDQEVHIFDTVNTYEGAHDVAYVCSVDEGTASQEFVTVHLGAVAGAACTTTPYPLQRPYNGSVPRPVTGIWDFDLVPFAGSSHPGQVGGVCVRVTGTNADFFMADPSKLNNRDTTGPYDDAFTSLDMPADGTGAVPYLPVEWFDAHLPLFPAPTPPDARRFHQSWFANRDEQVGTPYLNNANNFFHLMGVSRRTSLFGGSFSDTDVSFVFVKAAENRCGVSTFPAPDLPTCIGNVVVTTTDHELAHLFKVNEGGACTTTGGHDPGATANTSNDAWCSGTTGCVDPNLPNARCLMSGDVNDVPDPNPTLGQPPQLRDQINRMECEDLGACDPQPADPCNLTECGFGIRNQEDPQ